MEMKGKPKGLLLQYQHTLRTPPVFQNLGGTANSSELISESPVSNTMPGGEEELGESVSVFTN